MVNVIVVRCYTGFRVFRIAVQQLRQVNVCCEVLEGNRLEESVECLHLTFRLHRIVINMILDGYEHINEHESNELMRKKSMQTVIVKDTRVTKAIMDGMRLQCGISASTKAQLTNS